MLELGGHEVIAERQQDTRALLGWGKQGIVLAFRGTASFQNAISDLQVQCVPASVASFQKAIADPGWAASYSSRHHQTVACSSVEK